MSRCQSVARPLARQLFARPYTTTSIRPNATVVTPPAADAAPVEPSPFDMDPNTVLGKEFEAALMKSGSYPVGSRRRRAAIRSIPNGLSFEQLPLQAFQEARKILAADRENKLRKIEDEVAKIAILEARPAEEIKGGQVRKDKQLKGLRKHVEELKILADVNDPVIKKRFEDGLGDMTKPIYRYYAEKKWRSYDERLITQRVSQFSIVPDILPKFEASADVQLYFRTIKVAPGDIVDSAVSENIPRLRVQVFDKGERLVSVVVMDADVPDPVADGFTKRCHFMAANIKLDPTNTSMPLSKIKDAAQLAVPWMPAHAQKGAPYHRLAVFVLEQEGEVDVAKMKELYTGREGFSLKSCRDKFKLKPFGFTMFRSVWDENTAAVMARHDLAGADVEFRRKRVYSLKPPVKLRGWEAKRQGPKYRHVWKYTKRIKGLSNGRGWTKRK